MANLSPPTRPTSPQPTLTPQFCFNQTALRDFLRLSRATVDDSITQNLNALSTPSASPFDPTAVSRRSTSLLRSRVLPSAACRTFSTNVLFPSWKARSDILVYCANVATSPDPDDPSAIARQIEEAKNKDRVVNERLDPYSARYFPQEARIEELARTVREEKVVEGIVRQRTWRVLTESCPNVGEDGKTWEEAMESWEAGQS